MSTDGEVAILSGHSVVFHCMRTRISLSATPLVLLPFLFVACSSLPPWSPVPTGQQSVYGSIDTAGSSISFITFSNNPDIVAISIEYKSGWNAPRYALIADRAARTAIEEVCGKYLDWQKLALDNHVEITKEIKTITLAQMYRSGAGWESGGNRELRFIFSSRLDADNTPRIIMRVRSSTFFDDRDQFVLDDGQVRTLADSLKDEAVAAGFAVARKKQDTIDMFN
jgi:hypothetical protein